MSKAKPPLMTPMLVPSFSSCGFPQDKQQLQRVTNDNFRLYAKEFESLLVSAYDLYHGYVSFDDIPEGNTIIVDSGGYEVSQEDDDSAIYWKPQPQAGATWNETMLLKILTKLPDDPRFIFVNLDSNDNVSAQAHRAIAQLGRFSQARRTFLLKEELPGKDITRQETEYVSLRPMIAQLSGITTELTNFDILGVTEKSLGQSYFERLSNLRLLGALIKKYHLNLPIHIFGALDPLSVRIYTMAGADIFDGLTWLRFAYRGDECVYLNNELLKESDWRENISEEGHDSVYNRNYAYLMGLQANLREYRMTNDVRHLKLSTSLVSKVEKTLNAAEQSEDFRYLIG